MDQQRPRALVGKVWDDHVVAEDNGAPSVLRVALHLDTRPSTDG